MGFFLFFLLSLLPVVLLALHPSPTLKARMQWAAGVLLWLFATFVASGALAHHPPDGLTPPQRESWLVNAGVIIYMVACGGAWLACFQFKRRYPASNTIKVNA